MNNIMRLVVSKDVWEVPYLMHMVLALSSGHQRRLLDVHGQQKQLRALEFAEAGHCHRGLQLYQADLARKVQPLQETSKSGFDAMVAAMLITIVFTFALEDGSAHNDRPASDNEFIPRILNPMASTGGFKAIQLIYDALKYSTLLTTMLVASQATNQVSRDFHQHSCAFASLMILQLHPTIHTTRFCVTLRHYWR